jgi:hypothetical protein
LNKAMHLLEKVPATILVLLLRMLLGALMLAIAYRSQPIGAIRQAPGDRESGEFTCWRNGNPLRRAQPDSVILAADIPGIPVDADTVAQVD